MNNLWSKLYLNEKKFAIAEDLKYYVEQLEIKPIYYINQKLVLSSSIDNTIFEKTNDDKLNDDEIKAILEYIVYHTINKLVVNATNIIDNPLVGMCINSTNFILRNFGNKFDTVDMYPLSVENIFNSKIGHHFVIAIFPTKNGNKPYIIDPTYRQFCLLSYCNKNRIYHYEPYVMPGYFVKDQDPILFLLKNGYLESNEYTAKIYGDSFVLATESILKNEIILDSNYTGKQYIKSFINGVSIKNQK